MLPTCCGRAAGLGGAEAGRDADVDRVVENYTACWASLDRPRSAGHYAPADDFENTCRQQGQGSMALGPSELAGAGAGNWSLRGSARNRKAVVKNVDVPELGRTTICSCICATDMIADGCGHDVAGELFTYD